VVQELIILPQVINKYIVRSFSFSDSQEMLGWIRSAYELRMISGESGNRLTDSILNAWTSTSNAALVVASPEDNRPLGFCTLTRGESTNLPVDSLEVCHLIVNPAFRARWIGCHLIDSARHMADVLGYQKIVGRVVPCNSPMIALMRFKGCSELAPVPEWASPEYRWFSSPAGWGFQPRIRSF
jgi:RimJ/RimL family protein N-acetyltransferase